MNKPDVSDSVVDWVIEYSHAVALFEQLGIDYSCGGKSLEYACEQRGIDTQLIIREILNHPNQEFG